MCTTASLPRFLVILTNDCSVNDIVNPGWGWATYLLPYIDQANLYNELNVGNVSVVCGMPLGAQLTSGGNADLQKTAIPAFICPTDTGPALTPSRSPAHPATPGSHAKSNYAGVAGYDYDGIEAVTGVRGFMVDGTQGTSRMRSIVDGSSNTLAVGEKIRIDLDDNEQSQSSSAGEKYGSQWIGIAPDTRSATINQPLRATGTFAINGGSSNAFTSRHVGGILFLVADGSVHFLSENMDQELASFMAMTNDGEIAPIGGQ